MEYKNTTAQNKFTSEDGKFYGYASIFNTVDSYNDIIINGAFKDTLIHNKNNIKLCWQHNANKVIGKFIPEAPHETLLIIDATTGQNGILQAESFKEVTNITGIVLTKLDGTAKGGIVLAIKESVGIPVKFIGLGEGISDLKSFDIEEYIYGLFKDMM